MVIIRNKVLLLTLILTLVAGYCDSLTYVAANKVFSAHITGNIIVIASLLISAAAGSGWVNLIILPFFMVSVMFGSWLTEKFPLRKLLIIEGFILVAGGLLASVRIAAISEEMTIWKFIITMVAVLAMGLQNAVGSKFSKDTFGMTTMMTGNLIRVAINTESYRNSGFTKKSFFFSVTKAIFTIAVFFCGCIIGAWVARHWGLNGMAFPGLAMVMVFLFSDSLGEKPDRPD